MHMFEKKKKQRDSNLFSFFCLSSCPAAHNKDFPQPPGPSGESGLGSLDQQFRLHWYSAHHAHHPRGQRQHPHPLSRGPTLLRLPLVPACEVPQQVRGPALFVWHLCSVDVLTCHCYPERCVVFAGRTGTFLLQKCLPAFLWSSAWCPKRRRGGGRSRWPSVLKVRSMYGAEKKRKDTIDVYSEPNRKGTFHHCTCV